MTGWIVILGSTLAILLAGGAFGYIRKATTVKRELADLILANPASAAAVAYTFGEMGDLVQDGQALFHNADEPLALASTMKLVVLATYADAVANGELDPGERGPIADVERYYLPLTDGGAHLSGLKSTGLQAGESGFARDQAATIALDDLARIMLHYSGNAETDYLIARLGPDKSASVIQRAGLDHHTPIGLTLGPVLAIFDRKGPFSSGPNQGIGVDAATGDTSHLDRLTDLYLLDHQWRAAQIQFMSSVSRVSGGRPDMWARQAAAAQRFLRGTAREYAQMMARIAAGKFLSTQVSEIMQQKLESVPSDRPLRATFYARHGAKDGAAAGVLTLAAYAIPKRGPVSRQHRVIVVLTNRLSPEDWAARVRYQGHYLPAIDLAVAKGAFGRLASLSTGHT
jgi:hypothetical protein